MIGQCLSNKNKSATVLKSKKFLDLNKALIVVDTEIYLLSVNNISVFLPLFFSIFF